MDAAAGEARGVREVPGNSVAGSSVFPTGGSVNPTFTIVNIAIAVTEGIGKQLDPELDLISEALPYFMAHPPAASTGA